MNLKIYQIYQTNNKAQLNGTIVITEENGTGVATMAFGGNAAWGAIDDWVCKEASNGETWVFDPNTSGSRNPQKYPDSNGKGPQDYKSVIGYTITANSKSNLQDPDGGSGSGGQTGGQ